ncbi:MAG: pantetheine-phosphate adenylyltransferase [Defluviitaleaceae bacterium]|nr:pantetheine-phosphate adenylyltransferase [Defluviitaleaceae bacterium]
MKAIYPGSFDPITTGHVDIIKRAAKLCDELVVLVLKNSKKGTVFSIDERVILAKIAVGDVKNILVQRHDGLTAELAKEYGADAIIRGVRNMTDFDMESNIAAVNSKLAKNIETILLIAKPELKHISSSAVKELANYDADLSEYVPDEIREEVINELRHGR